MKRKHNTTAPAPSTRTRPAVVEEVEAVQVLESTLPIAASTSRSGLRARLRRNGLLPTVGYQEFLDDLRIGNSNVPTHSSPRQDVLTLANYDSLSRESTPPLPPGTTNQSRVRITNGGDFLKVLDCAHCGHCVSPPLHMCVSGHLTCNNCFTNYQDDCVSCLSPFLPTGEHYRVLEKVLNLVEVKCNYRGCPSYVTLEGFTYHVETCEYRNPVLCFIQHRTLCNGRILPVQDYPNHLISSHRSETCSGNPFLFSIRLGTSTPPKTFTHAGKFYMINITRDEDSSVRIWVSTTAEDVNIKNVLVNFKIQKPGDVVDNHKYLEWASGVHNVRTTCETVLRAGDCGLFHLAALLPYSLARLNHSGRFRDEVSVSVNIREIPLE